LHGSIAAVAAVHSSGNRERYKREGRKNEMVYDMCGSRYMAIQNKLEIHVCSIIITIAKPQCRTALEGFMYTGSEIQEDWMSGFIVEDQVC
jgi:hypothetical protein